MANLPFIGRLLYMHQQTNLEDWGRTRARSGVHKTDSRGSYAVEWPKLNLRCKVGSPRDWVFTGPNRGVLAPDQWQTATKSRGIV